LTYTAQHTPCTYHLYAILLPSQSITTIIVATTIVIIATVV